MLNTRRCVLQISGFIFIVSCHSVYADSNEYLDMELDQLLQIKVTGSTLRDESLQTVPSAVTVFTHEQISKLGVDYLYELINLVPGYQFNRNGDSPAGYTFSARGRRNSSEAREVLLLVDGRVFADPRTGSADGSLPLFPLAQIERVEIIRGPGSALYGSGAFNGVVNIISRKEQHAAGVELGSQNRRALQLLWYYQVGSWESNIFSRAYADDGEHYHLQSSPPMATNDPRKAWDIDLDVHNDSTQLRAAYHRIDTDNFYVAESVRNSFNFYCQLFRQLSLEHDLITSDRFKTHISASYVDITQTFNMAVLDEGYLVGLSQPDSAAPLLLKGILAGKTYRFAVDSDWTIDTRSSAQFGVEYQYNKETHANARNNFDLGQLAQGNFPINYYGDFVHKTQVGDLSSNKAVGLYGQYLGELFDQTRLTLGVRYDDYADIKGHFSPRVGLVHQLTEKQTCKLLYGEAFRAPSLSETGLMNNPVLIGNPDLSYEIVKTWDAIWMGRWNSIGVSLDGFRNNYKYPIATGLIGSTRTYMNGDDQYSEGVELEINRQLSENWLMRATYTDFIHLQDAAFREAQELSSLVINYERATWGWNVSTIYQTGRNALTADNNERELPSHWLTNSKLRYKLQQGYEISLQVKNMFNQEISTPAQGKGLPYGVPNRGREISVMLNWTL